MNLHERLCDWQLRLGLSRRTNPHAYRGPSAEDIARERSFMASHGIAVEPDEDPFAERFEAQRAAHGLTSMSRSDLAQTRHAEGES